MREALEMLGAILVMALLIVIVKDGQTEKQFIKEKMLVKYTRSDLLREDICMSKTTITRAEQMNEMLIEKKAFKKPDYILFEHGTWESVPYLTIPTCKK